MSFTRAILLLLLAFAAHAQDSVRTLAGHALQSGSQDGPAAEARFHDPAAIVSDPSGNLYIADSRNNAIRRIAPNGSVTTITASNPPFDTPSGLAISPHGLIISDTGNHIVRRLNADGSIVTIAGVPGQTGSENGSIARFDSPLGVAASSNGTIYVADGVEGVCAPIKVLHFLEGEWTRAAAAEDDGLIAGFVNDAIAIESARNGNGGMFGSVSGDEFRIWRRAEAHVSGDVFG